MNYSVGAQCCFRGAFPFETLCVYAVRPFLNYSNLSGSLVTPSQPWRLLRRSVLLYGSRGGCLVCRSGTMLSVPEVRRTSAWASPSSSGRTSWDLPAALTGPRPAPARLCSPSSTVLWWGSDGRRFSLTQPHPAPSYGGEWARGGNVLIVSRFG